jgi:hypothetical protein
VSTYTFSAPALSHGPLDFEAVRQAVPLTAFLQSLGLELQQEGDSYRCRCPLHNEQHGRSFIIYPDGRWFCHGKCAAIYSKGGDIVDLAGALWNEADRLQVIEPLLGQEAPRIAQGAGTYPRRQATIRRPTEPKWPARNLEQIDAIVRNGLRLYDIWESSPCRFDDSDNHAEDIVDIIFPGDPLLCIGRSEQSFATRPREAWRGKLLGYPLIVANPMLREIGLTQGGKESQHTLEATAARVYLPIECDFSRCTNDGKPTEFLPLIDGWESDGISTLDAFAAVIWHLKETTGLPLVLVVHSGGKSLHGWFAAFDRDEYTELWPFIRLAYSLGADHVTWCRSQFVRLPDGQRQNGVRQTTFYFNPSEAVRL